MSCLPPSAGTPSARGGMVWVPGGTFTMGDTSYPEEEPIRGVSVEGFWMDRTEVTNAEFAAFVGATGYVTVAERPVDVIAHPGLPPEMQLPGAVVFVMPNDVNG
ncbi:MAG: cysteine-type sulfatase aerobic maturase, partial [Alphaproteobacteria bacterium HGW-Alphaproteobacteria-12]